MEDNMGFDLHSASSLDDYIRVVDESLLEDNDHYLFFEHCYDSMEGMDKIIVDSTMYHLLYRFNSDVKQGATIHYPSFVQKQLGDIAKIIEECIVEQADNLNSIIMYCKPRSNIPEHTREISYFSEKNSRSSKAVEIFSYAIEGYKIILASLMPTNTKRQYN